MITLAELTTDTSGISPICIGERGENEASIITFDFSDWVTEYGDGTVTLQVKRKGDSASYPVTVETDDGVATWTISDVDTSVSGYGKAEFVYSIDDVVVKTAVFGIFCAKDIGDSDDVPDAYQTYIDEMTALGVTVQGYAETAQGYAETATTAAETAETAAETATTAAETAQTYAESAETSATAASESATSAASSASSASTSASSASASATSAASSATAAATSESNASDSADSASASATAAAASATEAAGYASSISAITTSEIDELF